MSQYIKKYSLFILLVLTLCSNTVIADSWLGTFWKALVGISAQEAEHQPASGSSLLQREASNYIDHLLATTSQNYRTQQLIREKKDSFIKREITQIEYDYYFLTSSEKIQRAQQMAHEWVLQLITEQANNYANEHINRMHHTPPINPAHLKHVSDRDVASNVTSEMLREAQEKAQSSHAGTLKEYVGDRLNKKVGFLVEREFGVYGSSSPATPVYSPPAPRPSAPPMEYAPELTPTKPLYPDLHAPSTTKEIFEIYPEFENDKRNKNFHTRREQGKLYREDNCCVCLKSFKKISRRVTLFCGHSSLCPSCLYDLLYKFKTFSCPICREEIKATEFPKKSLNPDMN